MGDQRHTLAGPRGQSTQLKKSQPQKGSNPRSSIPKRHFTGYIITAPQPPCEFIYNPTVFDVQ